MILFKLYSVMDFSIIYESILMNSKITITAITMFAVIMAVGAFAPAALAVGSNGQKTLLCHTDTVEPFDVSVININDRALPAHLAHGDVVIADPSECAVTPDPE